MNQQSCFAKNIIIKGWEHAYLQKVSTTKIGLCIKSFYLNYYILMAKITTLCVYRELPVNSASQLLTESAFTLFIYESLL